LTEKEQIKILNKRYGCLEHIIRHVHFNDKYPQFQNMLINDLKSNKALIFDANKNDFIVIKKDDLLDNLIESRINDIEDFYANHSNTLKSTTKNIIEKYVTKLTVEYDKPKSIYLKQKKDDIQMLMYNEKETIKTMRKTLDGVKLKNNNYSENVINLNNE